MEQRHDLLLHGRLQVDEQVAAADQVELGKGRIADQVLNGEDDRLAKRLGNLVVMVVDFAEKATQQIGGHVGGDALGVNPAQGKMQGFFVEIGGQGCRLAGCVVP